MDYSDYYMKEGKTYVDVYSDSGKTFTCRVVDDIYDDAAFIGTESMQKELIDDNSEFRTDTIPDAESIDCLICYYIPDELIDADEDNFRQELIDNCPECFDPEFLD